MYFAIYLLFPGNGGNPVGDDGGWVIEPLGEPADALRAVRRQIADPRNAVRHTS